MFFQNKISPTLELSSPSRCELCHQLSTLEFQFSSVVNELALAKQEILSLKDSLQVLKALKDQDVARITQTLGGQIENMMIVANDLALTTSKDISDALVLTEEKMTAQSIASLLCVSDLAVKTTQNTIDALELADFQVQSQIRISESLAVDLDVVTKTMLKGNLAAKEQQLLALVFAFLLSHF